MKLLLSYAQSDSRKAVRMVALRELHQLATKVPHTWTKEMVEVRRNKGLWNFIVDTAVAFNQRSRAENGSIHLPQNTSYMTDCSDNSI